MTKEELEKEVEEYIDKLTKDWFDGEYSFSVEELRQAIFHFAEPREKRIAELKQEAEEWVQNNNYPYSNCPNIEKKLKQAYLAGAEPREKCIAELETGKDMAETDLATVAYMQGVERYKPKWHDLRNNPNDLPEPYTTVLDENSDKVEYIGYGKWQVYSEYYERYSEVDPPIAWCKTPTFEE